MNIRQDLLLIKWLDNEWFYTQNFDGEVFNFAEIMYLKGIAPGIDFQVECDLTVGGKYKITRINHYDYEPTDTSAYAFRQFWVEKPIK